MIKITGNEYRTLSVFIHSICGIYLGPGKEYLLETRLSPLLRELGCANFSELYYRLRGDQSELIQQKIIDAITTGETFFFRDKLPFDLLRHKILPDLIDARRKIYGAEPVPIRIWSAACSTGQEVYSIAMTLRELLGNMHGYAPELLATDISDKALARASHGHYNQFEIARGLPDDCLRRYFQPMENSYWTIRDDIRSMVKFKRHNLFSTDFNPGMQDIIFLRNVMIYFTESDKLKLCELIASRLAPDGYLILGATESLTGFCPIYESKRYLRSIFYQLTGADSDRPAPAPTRKKLNLVW